MNMKQNFTITTKSCLGFQSIQAAGANTEAYKGMIIL